VLLILLSCAAAAQCREGLFCAVLLLLLLFTDEAWLPPRLRASRQRLLDLLVGLHIGLCALLRPVLADMLQPVRRTAAVEQQLVRARVKSGMLHRTRSKNNGSEP
jgi:hypothetical protein